MTRATPSAIPASPAAEPAPGDVAVNPQRRNFIFVAVLLGMLMAALDQTIVATALPTIVADLGGAGHQSWVVTSYLAAVSVMIPMSGWIAVRIGRRRYLLISVVLFVAATRDPLDADPMRIWTSRAAKLVRHTVQGDHRTMLEAENGTHLARLISACVASGSNVS